MIKIPVSGVLWDVWQVNEKKGVEEVVMTGSESVAKKWAKEFARDEHLGYKYKVERRTHVLSADDCVRRIK